jgi:Uma2 family endonuclease
MAPCDGGGIVSNVITGIRDPLAGPLTHRDLDDTPDDGNRYEVIDGELYVSPFPMTAHQQATTELVVILAQHARETGIGQVFASGLKVVLDELTGVGPDVVYIAREQVDGLRRDGFYGPPELVVEVLSSKPSLDTKVKRDKYARAKIRYYWIVDPEERTLSEFRLEGGAYVLNAQVGGDAAFQPQLFPRLTIPLGRLWLDLPAR